MAQRIEDKRAPMASAPMKYLPDGSVDWGNMWDTFCVLAKEGGPPHRPTLLRAQDDADIESEGYRFGMAEIIRGVREVSGLEAHSSSPGWIGIRCESDGHARWLSTAIREENVQARADNTLLFVPVGDYFTLKGEIKNVVTAVAKTTHYWQDHIPMEVRRVLITEARIEAMKKRVKGWFRRGA